MAEVLLYPLLEVTMTPDADYKELEETIIKKPPSGIVHTILIVKPHRRSCIYRTKIRFLSFFLMLGVETRVQHML